MRGLWKLTITHFRLFLREPIAFFFTLAFPTLVMCVFGAIYGNKPGSVPWAPGHGWVDLGVPSYAGMVIGTVALMSIPIDTASHRDSGVLRRYRATPLRPLTYIVASIIVYFAVAALGMAILVVAGRLAFRLQMPASWPGVIAGFSLSALAFFAAGYVIAGLARSARIGQMVGTVIFFPMMFLSGVGMPLEFMPDGVRRVSDFLPLTYVVKLVQGPWLGRPWEGLWVGVAVLGGMLVVGAAASARLFRWE